MTTLEQLKDSLQQAGFKIAPNPLKDPANECDWYAYKRSDIPARECECNEGKPAQIVVTPYAVDMSPQHNFKSCSISLRGEYENWWDMQAYNIPFDSLIDKLPVIEARLVAAWNALSTIGDKS